MTMTRGRRVRVQELLSGRDRNVSTAEMDSRSGPCVTIEILVSYSRDDFLADPNWGIESKQLGPPIHDGQAAVNGEVFTTSCARKDMGNPEQ